MDPLSHLLDGPRARRAFALRMVMSANWSVDVRDRAPLTIMAMLTGSAWLVAGGEPQLLQPGDVAIVRGPDPYTVSDDPLRRPDVIIHPGQQCTSASGQEVFLRMDHGVRTWGNAPDGETTMLIGSYGTEAEVTAAVTMALPRKAVVPAGHIDPGIINLLEREITSDAPGQGSSIDRLLDVLLVHTVRVWAQRHPDKARGWLGGSADPIAARALALFHGNPAESWTLESLARRLNVSRATLAGRFRASVGEPPMTYLTNWRMLLASEMLADHQLTTARIAVEVGYGSPFALSAAFKRRFGVSPTEYRRHMFPVVPAVNRGQSPASASLDRSHG